MRRTTKRGKALLDLFERSESLGRALPVRYDPAFAEFQRRHSVEARLARNFAKLKAAVAAV